MNPGKTHGRSPTLNNLPLRPSPFINREEEIRQAIGALLDSNVRAVALVGIAGIGKTSLALEIAYRLLDKGEFAGGIFWLPLRELQSLSDLNDKIRSVLGVSGSEVYARLNSQPCVLIFDGFDELRPEFVPSIERFLKPLSSTSKLLITSRQVPILPLRTTVIEVGTLSEQAATELLGVLGAQQEQDRELPSWYWQERIAEIVRVLGYHPLALTLGAHLIQGNYAEARKGFQQLLVAFDRVGTERERASALHADRIAGRDHQRPDVGTERERASALHALGDLQRLLDEYDTALTSYSRSLELYRAIGDRSGEASALQSLGDVQRLRGEWDSALASYHRALELHRSVGNRLGEANSLRAIGDVQQFRKELDSALAGYQQALELYRSVGDRLGEANSLQATGDVLLFLGDLNAALENYYLALELYRSVGDRLGEANVLHATGDIKRRLGDYDTAFESYRLALAIYREIGARLGEANTLQSISDIQRLRGELDNALENYYYALELYRQIGDRLGESNILSSIASILFERHDYGGAQEHYRRALALKESIGDLLGTANALVGLGQVLAHDDPRAAYENYQHALSIYEQIGDRYSIARTLYNLGLSYRNQGDLKKALKTLEQSHEGFVSIDLIQQANIANTAFADVAYELGKQYLEQDRWYDAVHLFEESLAVRRQNDDLNARADTIYQIARVHHLMGNLDKARIHYRDALRLYEHTKNPQGIAACETGLGRLMIQMGFLDDAVRELDSAKQIYRKLGDDRRIAEVEDVLQVANYIKERRPA